MSTTIDNPTPPTTGLPPLWRFRLEPIGDDAPVSERLDRAVRYAEGHGLRVIGVTLDLDPDGTAIPEAMRVKTWLKQALRCHELRARAWPADDEGTVIGDETADASGGTGTQGRPVVEGWRGEDVSEDVNAQSVVDE